MAFEITLDVLQKVLPKSIAKSIDQVFVDKINSLTSDPLVREAYRNNILSFTNVLEEGRFQIGHYIEAVRYITHKMMGDTNIKAYVKTFPDRYQYFINNGTNAKDIASYVTSYNKNKLVNLIREQSIIPSCIINADLYQDAINTQAAIMIDPGVNSRDRTAAANSLLQHLKPPEAKKIELDVTLKKDDSLQDLEKAMTALAAKQHEMIRLGISDASEIAQSNIITVKAEETDD